MRPLETEYKDWRIVVTTRPTGRGWSALVEVWAPGDDGKAAQESGRQAAVRFIDRQPARR